MKRHNIRHGAALLLVALAMQVSTARADIIPLGSAYHSTSLVNGSSLVVTDFSVAAAGTVSLSLTDWNFVALLKSLTTYVSSGQVNLYALSGAQSLDFKVSAGQVFSTSVLAVATAPGNAGYYSLDLRFIPTVAVPLVGAGWMLLSGLLIMGLFSRRAAAVTGLVSQ